MRVIREVEGGDELAVTFRADQEMDMGRPKSMPVLAVHELADRTIHRDEIAGAAVRKWKRPAASQRKLPRISIVSPWPFCKS